MKLCRIARALVIACVLAFPIATGAPPAGADAFGCAAWFPAGQPWTDSGAVLITAALDCRPAPAEFLVVLQLQYRAPGEDWLTRAYTRDYAIPDPRTQVGVYAQCEPGLWRGAATMWVTDKLGRQDQTVEFSSAPGPEVPKTCGPATAGHRTNCPIPPRGPGARPKGVTMSKTVQQLPCDQDPEHIPDRMTRRVLTEHAACGPRCRVWLAAAAAASVDLED